MPHQETVNKTWRWFWLFAAVHFILWTGVPMLTQRNAPLDSVEMLYWGHEWQWGYYKHPPLPAWAAESFANLFGDPVWPTYLLSQICIVGCFWAAWTMGRDVLKPWEALAGVAVLELSLYHTVTTPEFNNNVMANALWAMFALSLYRGIQRDRRFYWVFAGLSLGAAFLSKYDVVLLAFSLLVFSVVNRRARARWKTPGPYLMIGTTLLLIAPHLRWMVLNDFPTIQYVLRRSNVEHAWWNHIIYPFEFAGIQIAYMGVLLVMVVAALEFRFRIKPVDENARFHRSYLSCVVLGPLAIALLFSALSGARLGYRWGCPMFTYLGVLWFSWFEVGRGELIYRRVVWMSAVVGLVLVVGLATRNQWGTRISGRPLRVDFPGERLARRVETLWSDRTESPLRHVGGDWWIAGNINVYHPARPSVFVGLNARYSPWVDDRMLMRNGGVLVWDPKHVEDDFERELRERFPDAEILDPIELAWNKAPELEPLRVSVAIITTADEHVSDRPGHSRR
jgi:4-amino-4-deoxy-L-arabinose transferase-like glycosyltransferase